MRDEGRTVEIDGLKFVGERVTDASSGVGYIQLCDPNTGAPVVRVTHDTTSKRTRLATFGHALDRSMIEQIFAMSDFGLA